MAKQNVAVPADYFLRRVKQDYRDYRAALAREFLQNSVDAGATRIEFECKPQMETSWSIPVGVPVIGAYWLVARDNGRGASRDVIENKLLVLGRSGKDAETVTVGGFGLAKELLFFAWPAWQIRTHDMVVDGEAGTFEIKAGDYVEGFEARILIPASERPDVLLSTFRSYLAHCDVKAEMCVSGERVYSSWPRPVRALRDLDFGKVYRDKTRHDAYVSIRHHGVEMYREYNGHDSEAGRFVVELSGRSVDLLTANRDGLRHDQHRRNLQAFLEALTTDRRKATEEEEEHDIIEFFDAESAQVADAGHVREDGVSNVGRGPGVEVRGDRPLVEATRGVEVGGERIMAIVREGGFERAELAALHSGSGHSGLYQKPKHKGGIDRSEIPDYGVPRFALHTRGKALAKVRAFLQSEKAGRICRAWLAACQGILGALGREPDAVGFSFTETAEAECLKTNGRSALLVRPTDLPKSFTSEELIDRALHEAAHLYAGGQHGETWAIKEMEIRRAFRATYKTVRMAVERALHGRA